MVLRLQQGVHFHIVSVLHSATALTTRRGVVAAGDA